MFMQESLKGKKALVIGLGESGLSVSLLLKSLGAEVRVTDFNCGEEILKNVQSLSSEGIEVELGTHSKNFCKNVDFAILSPGVPLDASILSWLANDRIPVWGELEWASRCLSGKVLAVTGSNGKSTTSTLIWKMLDRGGIKTSLAGNIGRSLSRAILEDSDVDIWVLEVSSFQLETVEKFKPWLSLLLNVTPNHLDRYARFEDYIRAKLNIFKNQGLGDWAILNRSSFSLIPPGIKSLYVNSQGEEENGVFTHDGWIKGRIEGRLFEILPLKEIRIKGPHFLDNVMFASMAATLCGVSAKDIRSVVQQFRGLEHRQEIFGIWEEVTWVNDSKSTSVDAVRSALEAFEGSVIWIAGGRFKGGDFESLRALISAKVKEAHFYGEAAPSLSRCLRGACPIFSYGPLRSVIENVRTRAKSGDIVILSPGCSSFDQFRNFEDRGRFFKEQVNKLYVCATAQV